MDKEELFAMAQAMDTEEYCMLESNTSRVVVVPDRYKTFGVEEDTNVERVKFKFPKIVGDNVDLTTLNLRINFQNASGGLDKYVVDDVSETDDGCITFSWVIQDGVTPQSGQISFVVQAVKATEDGAIEKKWSTTLNKIGQVLEGLEVDETIEQQNPDIIESILTRLDELEENGGGGGTPGKDGREIELQNSGTAIQWRYVGDESWTDLVQLSEITGTKGDPGEDGITPTIGENGNWYLGETDTGKPSRGETPNIKIGTVQTLDPGNQATASMSGTPENPLLNLGIPKGEKGDPGEDAESGDSYTLPIMSDTQLGGGKAVSKTDEDVPVAVDSETGQLFVPTYPESASADIPRQEMQNTDTTVTLEPNKLYIFPEMSSLTVTLGTATDSSIVNEWHWFFDSGETACVFSLQNQDGSQVYTDAYSIDANMRYEVSVLHNVAYIKGVSTNET